MVFRDHSGPQVKYSSWNTAKSAKGLNVTYDYTQNEYVMHEVFWNTR